MMMKLSIDSFSLDVSSRAATARRSRPDVSCTTYVCSLGNQDALHSLRANLSIHDVAHVSATSTSNRNPNLAPTSFVDAMTSASVVALPIDVWSHVAHFLPVRDRVALLVVSVATREAVLRATKRRISDFLDGRGHIFHIPGGAAPYAPCFDVEANAAFARGLLRHAEYVLPCADAGAVLLAAMSSAFADSFDDVLRGAPAVTESERTDAVARFMKMASKDMSDRMKGKMVGKFLQLDIDLLEKEDAGTISIETRRQDFDAEDEDEQQFERSDTERLLFRAKMRIFVIIHVVLGCETLAHLRSEHDPDAGYLEAHFKWQAFVRSFLGLLSTRESTSVSLLRTLGMPNLRWYALRVTKVLAKRREDNKGESAISIMVKIFGLKSIEEEMEAYSMNSIKAFTNIEALETVDDFNFNLGEVYSPAEVFNMNIVALGKFLVLILRETNLEKASFAAIVSDLTNDWDPTFTLILLGYLWETCPETEYVLKDFMATCLVPEPIDGDSTQLIDLSAVRIGRMFLSLFEQRHHVRLTPTTCVSMFELASSAWSERDRSRVVWCIRYNCHVEQYLKLTTCEGECCVNGVNENVLALILFLIDHKGKVIVHGKRSCTEILKVKRADDAADCARKKSLCGLAEYAEHELDLFSQREEARLRPHAWLTRAV